MEHRRYLLLITILLSLCIYARFYTPKNIVEKNYIQSMEIKIDDWCFVEDIKLDKRIYEVLDPEAYIFRDYRNKKGRLVNLIVVCHKNDRWGAHDPVVCYKSQGWKIVEGIKTVKINVNSESFSINKFIVEKNGTAKIVYYYWFSSDAKITASRIKQMLDMVLNGLIRGYTESGFVEFSTRFNLLNEKEAICDINSFADKFTSILKEAL